MSKKPFAVGDRVRVYDTRLESGHSAGVITMLTDPNGRRPEAILVEGVERCDQSYADEIIVHPKQCRRLKPKVKPAQREPRRVFIRERDLQDVGSQAVYVTSEQAVPDDVEFVEVLKPAKGKKS